MKRRFYTAALAKPRGHRPSRFASTCSSSMSRLRVLLLASCLLCCTTRVDALRLGDPGDIEAPQADDGSQGLPNPEDAVRVSQQVNDVLEQGINSEGGHFVSSVLPMGAGDPRHKKLDRLTSYDRGFEFSVSEFEAESARTAIFRISTKRRNDEGKGATNWMYGNDGYTTQSSSVGTGWIVHQNPLILCTNAHVILDALDVSLQFPILGRQSFKGQVRMVAQDFDLAFVTFGNEAEFLQVVEQAGIHLRTLPIADISCPLGADVMAVGFPNGGELAKVAKGVISGTKTVKGLPLGSANNVCSSTAPISPGNSGGPLLFVNKNLAVAGVNFAADTKGQNNNYVVPGFRVKQLLSKLDLKNPESAGWPVVYRNGEKGDNWHVQVRLPRSNLVSAAGYPALKSVVGSCPLNKIFVSNVPTTSVFYGASPPLPKSFMILKIDNNDIDHHGQSRDPEYFSDPVSYAQIMWLRKDLTGTASVTVCSNSKTTTHTIPLRWRDDYDPKVPTITEPAFHKFDSELFAGVRVMELTMLQVNDLIANHGLKTMERFKLPSFQNKPRLFIAEVSGDAAKALEVGMVLEKVNGVPVSSLKDYRSVVMQSASSTDGVSMETDQGVVYAASVQAELAKQAKAKLAA